MSRYAEMARTPVPQLEPLDARQVPNNEGGYVYQITPWQRLERFLILGSDSNTFYQKAPKLTKENAAIVNECWANDPVQTARRISIVSDYGRAAKNDPAIFALALGAAHPNVKARQEAMAAIHNVCRTATHLFMFNDMCKALGRGMGRTWQRQMALWYENRSADQLAYQAIKYRQRENFTHKRLLRTVHPKDAMNKTEEQKRHRDPAKAALYNWICGKNYDVIDIPDIVCAHLEAMKQEDNPKRLVDLVTKYKLPWEALPTSALTNPDIWSAMLPFMGITAMIRNLGNMTRHGVLTPLDRNTSMVVGRLLDKEELRRGRVHPFHLLQAMAVYNSGKGFRGSHSWTPVPSIDAALEDAFYLSFETIVPTGKRILIGLDVSGSMSASFNNSPLTVAQVSATMAMVTMRTEKDWHVVAFHNGLADLQLRPNMSLDEVTRRVSNINVGGTDCALPMLAAAQMKAEVDAFQVQTDNETYAGYIHPTDALRQYRQQMGIPAKLAVIGFTSTGFTIADPNDAGTMDFVGFDSSAPAILANFIRGSLAEASADNAYEEAD